ncbi:Asp23/Gls24 family envelope stress response protein [Thermotoga sp.]|uniref:Asp23/Gls24 family envelope stress response protein n=1 Tax=Thermotoga sp. TaxID=28240 RepID=UPI0025FAA8BE|nr:Asp23/Gls24 family envelope stress response protein [Thermotoga sp.]MCD6550788.1 Asp23/Gls24 family envelope stress response protein [Thermotoga sp.]
MAEEYKNIEISDGVIKEIAIRSIEEFLGDVGSKVIKKIRKSLDVTRNPDDSLVIEFKIDVPYGEPIPEYVSKLTEKIKHDIEMMTSMRVESINVAVENVFEREEEIEEEPEEGSEEKNE